MKQFLTVWVGQFASLIGTGMTRFALLIWAYNQTESAFTVALLGFASFIPFVIFSPIAGVWIDRLPRRRVMMLADSGAAVMTAGMLGLLLSGRLEIWHLVAAQGVAGLFEAFQLPAYTALTTQLVAKHNFARINGFRAVAEYGSQVAAPILAGALLPFIDLQGIMTADLLTFGVAITTLIIVKIPMHRIDPEDGTGQNFWREIRTGFSFIWERPGLRGILLIFSGINFFAALTYFSILPAMILARTGSDELILATVQATLGGAGVLGGVVLSIWGGPKKKINTTLGFAAFSFLLGDFLFAIGRTPVVWVTAAALAAFCIPFIAGSYRAIWQIKVRPSLQGRVFGVQSMIQQAAMPLGYLLGGALADSWLEPAMQPGEPLAAALGWLVGTGPGAGMALMFVFTAVAGCLISLAGFLSPSIRHVEEELPDF